ncbi:Chch domain protein [Mycena kentingensis (nom. inval.)]|nr:Chch domain protein [Mycena kentingensis (nom. inval.)]
MPVPLFPLFPPYSGQARPRADPQLAHRRRPSQRRAHHPDRPHSPATAGQPGMLAQMASTAASVAVGSTIGHGLSNMLFGGQAAAPVAEQTQAAPTQGVMNCQKSAEDFTLCLEKADLNSCSYFLEQLKACQAAAKPY